jgi:hypothetical protein
MVALYIQNPQKMVKFNMFIMRKNIILIITIIIFCSYLNADTWEEPAIRCYFSDNVQYCIKVYSTIIPDNYYKWLTSSSKKKAKFSVTDTAIISCYATLYEINNNDTVKIWEQKFINRFTPLSAIVSDDGKHVVTFNNWYSIGYGQDVMVVYDQKGNLKKMYSLEAISPFPVNYYRRTISSILWLKKANFISNEEIEIFEGNQSNLIIDGHLGKCIQMYCKYLRVSIPFQRPEALPDKPGEEFESSFLEENSYRKVMMVVPQLQKLMHQDYTSSNFDDEYKS